MRVHRCLQQQQQHKNINGKKVRAQIITASEIIAHLKTCKTHRDVDRVIQARAAAVQSGEDSDIFVANSLVSAFARCGSMVESRRVFDRIDISSRTVFSWNFLLRGYVENGEPDTALDLFEHSMNCHPNPQTFVAVLKACSKLALLQQQDKNGKVDLLEKSRALLDSAVASGSFTSLYVANKVVDLFVKCGSIENAKYIFDKLPHHDNVTYTSLMQGYVQHGQPELALSLFEKVGGLEGGNGHLFLAALKACGCLAEKEAPVKDVKGKPVKAESLRKGLRVRALAERAEAVDVFVVNEMISLYSKCGSLEDAKRSFDELVSRDVLSWNTMMLGYSENGKGDAALELYTRMSCGRNVHTYVAALKACACSSRVESGKMIHADVCKAGLEEEREVVSGLINLYGRFGRLPSAQNVFDSVGAPNSLTWTALISGYSSEGELEMVFELFWRMVEEGLRPDVVTFVCLLSACNKAGLVGQGWKVFNAMQGDGFKVRPGIEHYSCMVELLGRSNWLHDAVALLREMEGGGAAGVKVKREMWKGLLRYCRKWKNFELGKIAFESLVKLDDRDMKSYLMMTKLYGGRTMWAEHGFKI